MTTCETNQVLLAGVSGGFSQGTPVSTHQHIGSSRYKCNNLERDVKLNKKQTNKKRSHSLSKEHGYFTIVSIYDTIIFIKMV